MSNVWVLTRTTISREVGEEDYTKICGVYAKWDDVLTKLEAIRRANPQYEMVETSPYSWRIGPDEDEGFFGNRPVYLRAEVAEYHE